MVELLDKRYAGAPFGTQTARFDVSGVHPDNKTPASFTQTPYCSKSMNELNRHRGPGKYDVTTTSTFSADYRERIANEPGWARQQHLKRLSELPHLLHKDQFEMKKLIATKLGPGSYNIKSFLEDISKKPRSSRGVCATKGSRLGSQFMEKTPGPGTYGQGGVPHAAKEEKDLQSPGVIGMLDAAASSKRDLPKVGCHLGPGNYQHKSSVDELNKRTVSLKGPYELFTIDRNKPIKTGHYADLPTTNLGPGQYNLSSFTDGLVDRHTKGKGRFSKTNQHPQKAERIFYSTLSQVPKRDKDPGPGMYFSECEDEGASRPSTSRKAGPGHMGFLSSSQRADKRAMQFFTGNFNAIGVGRYNIGKFHECRHINGHRSAFVSKSQPLAGAKEKAFRERVQGKNIAVKDRAFLLPTEKPDYYPSEAYSTSAPVPGKLKRCVTIA